METNGLVIASDNVGEAVVGAGRQTVVAHDAVPTFLHALGLVVPYGVASRQMSFIVRAHVVIAVYVRSANWDSTGHVGNVGGAASVVLQPRQPVVDFVQIDSTALCENCQSWN